MATHLEVQPGPPAGGDTREALATENARLARALDDAKRALKRAADRTRRLQAILTDLASALTREDVAAAVIDHGTRATRADATGIWTLAPGETSATLMQVVGVSSAAKEAFRCVPLNRPSPLADAIRTRMPVFVESAEELAERYPTSAARVREAAGEHLRGTACLPLIVQGEALGALTFGFRRSRTLDDGERAFLTLVADHCAQGLYRARLYEAEQRARERTALFYGFVESVGRAGSLQEIYDAALRLVEKALHVERSSILTYDASRVMRFRAWRGLSEAYRVAADGHSPWTPDDRAPVPILVSDTETDATVERYRGMFRAEGIRAVGFVPLVYQGKLVGKFMLYAAEPRVFTEAEVRLSLSIAQEVAHALARKAAELENTRLLAEAESANQSKDEFLGIVSHELRTPLASIVGWSSILKTDRRNDPSVLARGLDAIDRNARMQANIVDDILDVSRIVTGKLTIDPRPVSLVAAVAEAVEAVKLSAAAKDIALVFEAPSDPFTVIGDGDRLRQVAWNIVSNAIKFTPQGGRVRVDFTRRPGSCSVRVTDTGKGIAPDLLPHVFERFRQGDSSSTRGHGGLGLGLAIVRHLVELHGGQVEAESAGTGACFTVTLPVKD